MTRAQKNKVFSQATQGWRGAQWARRPHNEKYENSGHVALRSYVSTKIKSFQSNAGMVRDGGEGAQCLRIGV